MGLKPYLQFPPKDTPVRPADFVSFIQSCGGGCNFMASSKSDQNYFRFLSNNNVEAVSHGHVPHCMPHPLVFARPFQESSSNSVNSIVFIENDTSNGNRPKNGSGLISELPFSYIELANGTNKYGIGFLKDGVIDKRMVPLTKNNKEKYANESTINKNQLKKLLIMGESLPRSELLSETNIQALIKFNENGFAPLSFKGGKSIKRKNKKTRKNKNKKTKKHCNHRGCKYH